MAELRRGFAGRGSPPPCKSGIAGKPYDRDALGVPFKLWERFKPRCGEAASSNPVE